MRHARRNGNAGHEFGGSGEDSFVAVVVTKLTGALLFILLLTMVIMALLPKADLPTANHPASAEGEAPALAITTPAALPEAIAGRPYVLALAASGGRGSLKWSIAGDLPDGLTLDPASGRIEGTPSRGTPHPAELVVHVSDGTASATQPTKLLVYQSDQPLTTPAWWRPGIPPIPWRAWLEQGYGFLVLWLVHIVGMNTINSLRRWSSEKLAVDPNATDDDQRLATRRYAAYRWTLRLASLSATLALGAWLWQHHA